MIFHGELIEELSQDELLLLREYVNRGMKETKRFNEFRYEYACLKNKLFSVPELSIVPLHEEPSDIPEWFWQSIKEGNEEHINKKQRLEDTTTVEEDQPVFSDNGYQDHGFSMNPVIGLDDDVFDIDDIDFNLNNEEDLEGYVSDLERLLSD